ncbi:hypothetical protein [Frigoribacterium sp. UYMn621]|uniref:hypothetical protein n=1 Tax=Frigoribacterium sp. UYMn621 TaxID=3156343 RepID=UPI003396AC80
MTSPTTSDAVNQSAISPANADAHTALPATQPIEIIALGLGSAAAASAPAS